MQENHVSVVLLSCDQVKNGYEKDSARKTEKKTDQADIPAASSSILWVVKDLAYSKGNKLQGQAFLYNRGQ